MVTRLIVWLLSAALSGGVAGGVAFTALKSVTADGEARFNQRLALSKLDILQGEVTRLSNKIAELEIRKSQDSGAVQNLAAAPGAASPVANPLWSAPVPESPPVPPTNGPPKENEAKTKDPEIEVLATSHDNAVLQIKGKSYMMRVNEMRAGVRLLRIDETNDIVITSAGTFRMP